MRKTPRITVVIPTLDRPREVGELLGTLTAQTLPPIECIVVDGAPPGVEATARAIEGLEARLPFRTRYLRQPKGTATQRNRGIEAATGELVAFLDDDVRPQPDYFERISAVFLADPSGEVGGIAGYRTNQHFRLEDHRRWRWYRRLRLLSTFEPGRYDRRVGVPINANLQEPFTGVREVDFMTTACAVWRRDVFDQGLRFDEFFADYGVLEDAHFSLRAARRWKLLQCGDAHCVELSSPGGRVSHRALGYKSVVNYYFVFDDLFGPLTFPQKARFWSFQAFELLRIASAGIFRRRRDCLADLRGRTAGIVAIFRAGLARRSLRTLGTATLR